MRRLLALALFATLTPVALARMPWGDKPAWSEVDGALAAKGDADTVGLTVLSVDKKSLNVPKSKLTLDPGPHGLLLASSRASSSGSVAVSFRFEAAACVRYRLAGRQASPDDARLQIVVVAQEPIEGCNAPAGTVVANLVTPAETVAVPVSEPVAESQATAAPALDAGTSASPDAPLR